MTEDGVQEPLGRIANQEHDNTASAKKVKIVDGTGSEITTSNRLPVDAELTVQDIEIGAVEIKDGESDTRAKVKSDGTDNAQVVYQNAQPLPTGAATEAKQDDMISELQTLNSLVPSVYDYVELGYTGDNLTSAVFKSGGAGGSTVSTLTLAYSGSNLTSVTRS